MTVSKKGPDQGQTPADTGAGIAVASVWLVLLHSDSRGGAGRSLSRRRSRRRLGCTDEPDLVRRRKSRSKLRGRHLLRANCGRGNLTGEGDSCARVRVGVLAHHRSDAFANRGQPWHLISDQSCRLIRSLNKKSTLPAHCPSSSLRSALLHWRCSSLRRSSS